MSFNHIEETTKVIVLLNAENQIDSAKKLQDTMRSASTGTELIMGVRFHLLAIQPDSVSISTMRQIQNLIGELDKILQR